MRSQQISPLTANNFKWQQFLRKITLINDTVQIISFLSQSIHFIMKNYVKCICAKLFKSLLLLYLIGILKKCSLEQLRIVFIQTLDIRTLRIKIPIDKTGARVLLRYYQIIGSLSKYFFLLFVYGRPTRTIFSWNVVNISVKYTNYKSESVLKIDSNWKRE